MSRIILRKVHVDDQVWKWYVQGWKFGEAKVGTPIIFDPDKKRYEIPRHTFCNMMRKTNGSYTYYPDESAIAPSDIVTFIQTFIKPLRVVDSGQNVSIMLVDGYIPFAVAGMDRTDKHWWLARVNVKKPWRRKGYGTWMIELLRKHARDIPIFVAPGGYDVPHEVQCAFYSSCGFVKQEDGMLLDTKRRYGDGEKETQQDSSV